MFVVRRPFRNLGKVHTAGSVIPEPAIIKRFKGKLAEGKIIEVTEQTYDSVAKYFRTKYGVVLPPLAEEVKTEEIKVETEEVETEEVETEETKAETEEAQTTEAKEVKAKAKTKVKAVAK